MVVELFLKLLGHLTPATTFKVSDGIAPFGQVAHFNELSSAEFRELRAALYNYATFIQLHAMQLKQTIKDIEQIQEGIRVELGSDMSDLQK